MPRPLRTVLAAVAVTLLAATAAACGDAGGLEGAGATPTATSPAKLWPDLAPASSPAWDYDNGEAEAMHVTAPRDDIRRVRPSALVRQEIAQHPGDYAGSKAPYRVTARRMAYCDKEPADSRCPLLKAYYRDMTGDGKPDLTLGFRLLPGNQTAVRVYTVEAGRVVQVMSNNDAVSGVELAGRSVIIHAPSDLADYEYRFQWTWDPEQKVMLLTHDEMLRIGRREHGLRHPGHPSPSVTP
ncbi:hypothetical protein PO587_29195 [Streptomyces gilvifuscus]|uniref:Lipoprotein n=1 Tax=Streptomyces gilvifuscus TaxID=1550617 RepID=A0ABT5G1D5_9ACTN|nr:hypothetical protein [Streptomyces gilvifuscus]MDC2958527.1 hypothetical protein [Streptomyces gilvifuscus]